MSNINKLYNIWVKNENLISGTYSNVSLYTQAKADLNTLTTTSLGVGCADPSINYILDVSGNQRTRGNLDVSGVITSPWLDASFNARAYDASCVHLAGDETITGLKTFTQGLKLSGGGIDLSNNSIVNPSAIRMYGGSIQTNGGIYFQATNLNRKLTLYPITNGECGNHSIGVNTNGTNFQFMIPDINRKYTMSYGTGASTKTDILTIDPSNLNITDSDNGLVMRNNCLSVKKSDNTMFFHLNPQLDDAYFRGTDFAVRGGVFRVANSTDTETLFTYNGNLESVGSLFIYDSSNAVVNRRMVVDADGLTMKKGGIQIEAGDLVIKQNGQTTFSYTTNGDRLDLASNFRIYDNSFATPNIAVDYTPEAGFKVYNDVEFKGGGFQYLNADGSTNLIFGNPQGTIQSKTSKHWYTANQTVITGTYTVPKPWDEYYGIDISGSAYTITLPTITNIDAGNPITFRKVIQTGASFTISFQSNGTQRLFSNSLTGSTTAVGIMTSTVYYITLVPMWDKFQNDWGWFRVV